MQQENTRKTKQKKQNKKTDNVKAAQKYFRAHSLSFLYTFWHVLIMNERHPVLGLMHTLLVPPTESVQTKYQVARKNPRLLF